MTTDDLKAKLTTAIDEMERIIDLGNPKDKADAAKTLGKLIETYLSLSNPETGMKIHKSENDE